MSGSGNKAWIEAGKKNLAEGRKKARYPTREEMASRGMLDPQKSRERRLQQIALERAQAEILVQDGWEIFSPTVVCDRVGVKDGRIFFIDFKKRGREKLRSGQKRIRDLAPEMYKVVVHE